MRGIVTFVLTVGSGVLTGPAVAAQGTPARPALAACSLLPKDVVAQVTPYDNRAFERVTMIPPNEESAGKSGSACSYGGIHLQVDPFSWSVVESRRKSETQRGEVWEPLADLGDAAYFHDNRGRFAELAVHAGTQVLTIQMDVPPDRTTAAVKPNAIALARALLPKLR
jgi:hypothetical protein